MPEYKDVLREDLPKYMNVIKAMLSECEHRFSFALLQFLIITMYEYCLCFVSAYNRRDFGTVSEYTGIKRKYSFKRRNIITL